MKYDDDVGTNRKKKQQQQQPSTRLGEINFSFNKMQWLMFVEHTSAPARYTGVYNNIVYINKYMITFTYTHTEREYT